MSKNEYYIMVYERLSEGRDNYPQLEWLERYDFIFLIGVKAF